MGLMSGINNNNNSGGGGGSSSNRIITHKLVPQKNESCAFPHYASFELGPQTGRNEQQDRQSLA